MINYDAGSVDVEKYEDECIWHSRKRNGKLEYLVKWKHFPESDNTWELDYHFDTSECIEEYWSYRT